MAETAPLRPAATVIVLRPADAHPFDVLLVRRNDAIAFMGGAHVFPGGRVDDTDDASPADACTGFDTLGRCADLTPEDEARYRVAGIRELLEEAGLLLARRDGRLVDHDTASSIRASLTPKTSIVAHLATRGLTLALDAVMPFAHWVTPALEIRRFDTRFLLACTPGGQHATHDDGEMTALEWLAPGDAIASAERGLITLPPPTWCTLRRLSTFGSIDQAWQWASTTPIARIEPVVVRDGTRTTMALPEEGVHFEVVDGRWLPRPP